MSPNVKEVSASGLRITAAAQFVISEKKEIHYCRVQKILVPCGSGIKGFLGVDIAVRGVDIAVRGVDINSFDVDIGVGN